LKGREHSEDIGVDGRIIIELNIEGSEMGSGGLYICDTG
jgi:hypothetical protein